MQIFYNIMRFVLFLLVQLLILNNIQFLGFINPLLYVLFILTLPIGTPRWLVLVSAFFLGLIVDMFSNTMGLNAFATVLVAFLRPSLIKFSISLDDGVDIEPSFRSFGIGGYIRYAVFMVLIHNATLFLLESLSLMNLWLVFVKILLNSIITLLLILGVQMLSRR